jgi:P27 family predicted phage terminase small subunit
VPQPRRLAAIREREGNVRHMPIPAGVRLPAEAPVEPDWKATFPIVYLGKKPGAAPPRPPRPGKDAEPEERVAYGMAYLAWTIETNYHRQELREYDTRRRLKAEALRCRAVASATWRFITPWLDSQHLIAQVDGAELEAYCTGVARIDQAERDLTRRGLNVPNERGMVKNGSVTVRTAYRTDLRPLIEAFGLTPLARDKISPRDPDSPEGGSPFDV